jgi:hypothetical protein
LTSSKQQEGFEEFERKALDVVVIIEGWKSAAPSTFEEYEPALLGTHGGRRSAFPPCLYREEIR